VKCLGVVLFDTSWAIVLARMWRSKERQSETERERKRQTERKTKIEKETNREKDKETDIERGIGWGEKKK
jgi:hypothetical protein